MRFTYPEIIVLNTVWFIVRKSDLCNWFMIYVKFLHWFSSIKMNLTCYTTYPFESWFMKIFSRYCTYEIINYNNIRKKLRKFHTQKSIRLQNKFDSLSSIRARYFLQFLICVDSRYATARVWTLFYSWRSTDTTTS